MGEHNRLILGELLCRTDDELAALEEQGIIGYAPTTIVAAAHPAALGRTGAPGAGCSVSTPISRNK